MSSAVVVYPMGRDADLIGNCPNLQAGEAGWLTTAPDDGCALCQIGICQQRLSYGTTEEGPIVIHTMAGMA